MCDHKGCLAGWAIALIVVGAIIASSIIINHVVSLVMCVVADNNVKDSYTVEEAIKEIEKITGEGTVTFGKTKVQIENSYKIKSRYDRIYISKIIQNTVDNNGNRYTSRSTYDLVAEWTGHNFISLFSKENEQTDNVNLDFNFWENKSITIIGAIGFMVLRFF